MVGYSGADLERQRMLREAGILEATAQGYDAPLLEQITDRSGYIRGSAIGAPGGTASLGEDGIVPDDELPSQLRRDAALTTDWNNASASGWFKSDLGALNTPYNIYWVGIVVAWDDQTWIEQEIWDFTADDSFTDSKRYRRQFNNGTWTAWYKVLATQVELDARYKNVNELVADNELPLRIGPRGDTTIADWNTATKPGFYSSDAAINSPGGGQWWQVLVETHDNGVTAGAYVTQTAHKFAPHGGSTDTNMWRRQCDAGTWSAWYRLRWSEVELDARYGAVLNGQRLEAQHVTVPVTDCNNVVNNGWYVTANTALNQPVAHYGFLQVQGDFTNTIQEIQYFGLTTSLDLNRWRRVRNSGVWGAWKREGEDTGWVEVGSGGAPAFQNSWVNFGAPHATVAYRKIGNRVHLKGLAKSGPALSTMFTLPVGYRPSVAEFIISTASADTYGQVNISTVGAVYVAVGSGTWFSLSGISFLVD